MFLYLFVCVSDCSRGIAVAGIFTGFDTWEIILPNYRPSDARGHPQPVVRLDGPVFAIIVPSCLGSRGIGATQ